MDFKNFDFGYYIDNVIVLCKYKDDYIKCFYYGQNMQNIANGLNILSHIPYNTDYVIEIPYKNTNNLDVFICHNFNKIGSLIKFYRKKSQLNKDFIIPDEIEYATINDADRILYMQNTIFDKFVERHIERNYVIDAILNKQIIVYKLNNNIAGFMIYNSQGKNWHLEYIAVDKKYNGMGIGSKLLKSNIKIHSEKTASLWVRYDNHAINMYKKHGFIETNIKTDIYLLIK